MDNQQITITVEATVDAALNKVWGMLDITTTYYRVESRCR